MEQNNEMKELKETKGTLKSKKFEKPIHINKYDFDRAYLMDDGVTYCIDPENIESINMEQEDLILFLIARSKNKNFICSELQISPNLFQSWMHHRFGHTKVTKIRELIVLDKTGKYQHIQDRIQQEPKKKTKKQILEDEKEKDLAI